MRCNECNSKDVCEYRKIDKYCPYDGMEWD